MFNRFNPFKKHKVESVFQEAALPEVIQTPVVEDPSVPYISIGENVRVEQGPKLVTEIATRECIDDTRTAAHYQFGRLDALGNEIVEGQEFTYLAWGGSENAPIKVWYVYEWMQRMNPETGEEFEAWTEIATFDDKDEAIEYAQTLKV